MPGEGVNNPDLRTLALPEIGEARTRADENGAETKVCPGRLTNKLTLPESWLHQLIWGTLDVVQIQVAVSGRAGMKKQRGRQRHFWGC